MRITFIIFLFLSVSAACAYSGDSRSYMISHPESFITIPKWSVYSAWGGVGILHNLEIVNSSDVEYANIRVRIYYSSTSPASPANVISQQTGTLPVTLPPRSKAVYLKEGITFGANSQFMNPVRIEVLGALHNP